MCGIRLETPADIDSPAVVALIAQAAAAVINAEVEKQRARRPAAAKA